MKSLKLYSAIYNLQLYYIWFPFSFLAIVRHDFFEISKFSWNTIVLVMLRKLFGTIKFLIWPYAANIVSDLLVLVWTEFYNTDHYIFILKIMNCQKQDTKYKWRITAILKK